ncbi:MAG: hypothetical protein L6414_18175 [Hydrogenophaga sp.]|uniref:hypothetical protein n=1 Tax=Hydrogenophaga sp. TaxID=1904254 RepID=UPI0025C4EEC2|nr:hypothetical protein [Hydrogenophaga sp.]MCG2657370.1 hypothetical protein [Hydrogenophaga sp.]
MPETSNHSQPLSCTEVRARPPTDEHAQTHRRKTRPATHLDLVKLFMEAGTLGSKTSVRELLLNKGYRANTESIDEYTAMDRFLRCQRNGRLERRFQKRFGASPELKHASFQRGKYGPLPTGTPQQRLMVQRKAAIHKCAKSCFRLGAAGGHSFAVTFAGTSSEVQYHVAMDSNRTTFRGAYKGWSANEDHHRLCVPADWRRRVERRGLAVLDGIMTLDAHLLHEQGGVAVYAAVWARQGRGYQVTTERGYLAVGYGLAFHAETAEQAMKGLERKNKAAGRAAPLPAMALDTDAFVERFSRYRNLMVSVDDARESGSCEYGIRSWCEAVGIDIELHEVPLQRLLAGFRQRPQVEVRRAVLHAVRTGARSQ